MRNGFRSHPQYPELRGLTLNFLGLEALDLGSGPSGDGPPSFFSAQRLQFDGFRALRPGPKHQFPGCLMEGSGLPLKAEARSLWVLKRGCQATTIVGAFVGWGGKKPGQGDWMFLSWRWLSFSNGAEGFWGFPLGKLDSDREVGSLLAIYKFAVHGFLQAHWCSRHSQASLSDILDFVRLGRTALVSGKRKARRGRSTWLLLGNILHFCLLWFSGKSSLDC